MAQPERQAREEIDRLLAAAGWHVCDYAQADIRAARGIALREFPLEAGHGCADYLLYVDGKAAGIIEAKKQGATLTGVDFCLSPNGNVNFPFRIRNTPPRRFP